MNPNPPFPSPIRLLARRVVGLAAVGSSLFFGSCSVPATTAMHGPEWHRVRIGLCEDYPEESRTLVAAKKDLAFARQSGAKVLRVAFGWDAMEPQPGKFDWSFWDEFVRAAYETEHVELIPYICYTPRWAAHDAGENFWRSPPRDDAAFARFVAAAVSRYRRHIRTWELWNEPDNPSYWLGTRQEYAALVKAGAEAVRRSDPTARVVLGGIATNLDFLERLFRDDHIAPSVDVVNFHSYLETWHGDSIERLTPTIERVAQIVRDFGEREPLWLAETGYSSVGGRPQTSDYYRPSFTDEHTDLAQARALMRMIVLANCSGAISTVAWYRIHDLPAAETVIGDDNNRHLGLIAASGEEKPAARAFADIASLFSESFRVLPVEMEPLNSSTRVEAHLVETASGRRVLFAWNAMPGSAGKEHIQSPDTRAVRVVLRLPGLDPTGEVTPARWALDPSAPLTRLSGATDLTIALTLRGPAIAVFELNSLARQHR